MRVENLQVSRATGRFQKTHCLAPPCSCATCTGRISSIPGPSLSFSAVHVPVLPRCPDDDRPRLGGQFRRAYLVRRADVREHREHVGVRPYVISRHLSICKNRKKDIDSVVGECPAIRRVGRRLAGIIRTDVRQQNPGRSLCVLRCIPTRVPASARRRR
jgi:hypothetical protein